jgi:hypothetical protein
VSEEKNLGEKNLGEKRFLEARRGGLDRGPPLPGVL